MQDESCWRSSLSFKMLWRIDANILLIDFRAHVTSASCDALENAADCFTNKSSCRFVCYLWRVGFKEQ
ncbi:hypothetical protein CEXT_283341 [Caerostris extrusa]|uniref:Uncharacterized protein n=1 Tax=Caerostris extrusa TaxID=172846 RepID=A0AAV4MDW6_CAEEX|nr:hypothetical protein CEXT_283341 [Caerostris extrusa]